jgi:uncharacterized protein (TIGR02246 family)
VANLQRLLPCGSRSGRAAPENKPGVADHKSNNEEPMKPHVWPAIGLLIALAAPAMAPAQEKASTCIGPHKTCQELEQFARDFEASYNRQDATALAALFTQDAVNVTEGPILHGRQAIETFYADVFAAGWSGLTINVDQSNTTDNVTTSVGAWGATGPGPNRTSRMHRGNWADVLVREAGSWKIRLLSSNVVESEPIQLEANWSTRR